MTAVRHDTKGTTIAQIHEVCGGCIFCAVDSPASAKAERLGLLPLTLIYRCKTCLRFMPWCFGSDDNMPDDCDQCWREPEATA